MKAHNDHIPVADGSDQYPYGGAEYDPLFTDPDCDDREEDAKLHGRTV